MGSAPIRPQQPLPKDTVTIRFPSLYQFRLQLQARPRAAGFPPAHSAGPPMPSCQMAPIFPEPQPGPPPVLPVSIFCGGCSPFCATPAPDVPTSWPKPACCDLPCEPWQPVAGTSG